MRLPCPDEDEDEDCRNVSSQPATRAHRHRTHSSPAVVAAVAEGRRPEHAAMDAAPLTPARSPPATRPSLAGSCRAPRRHRQPAPQCAHGGEHAPSPRRSRSIAASPRRPPPALARRPRPRQSGHPRALLRTCRLQSVLQSVPVRRPRRTATAALPPAAVPATPALRMPPHGPCRVSHRPRTRRPLLAPVALPALRRRVRRRVTVQWATLRERALDTLRHTRGASHSVGRPRARRGSARPAHRLPTRHGGGSRRGPQGGVRFGVRAFGIYGLRSLVTRSARSSSRTAGQTISSMTPEGPGV